jgi:hypothetical protein
MVGPSQSFGRNPTSCLVMLPSALSQELLEQPNPNSPAQSDAYIIFTQVRDLHALSLSLLSYALMFSLTRLSTHPISLSFAHAEQD